MGCRNKITKTVSNPLTDVNSEFYVPPEEYRYFLCNSIRAAKRNPLYKKARFIFVYKVWESPNTYRLLGTNRRTRHYAISILTDDNRFYYNEYTTKHTVLSQLTASNMARIFLDGYVIDNNTTILFDSKVKEASEPIRIFLSIVAKTVGIAVRQRDTVAMMGTLNRALRGVVKLKKGTKFQIRHRQYFKRGLIKKGWFDFLPKELMEQMTDKSLPRLKNDSIFYAAMGALYLFRMDLIKKWSGKSSETV